MLHRTGRGERPAARGRTGSLEALRSAVIAKSRRLCSDELPLTMHTVCTTQAVLSNQVAWMWECARGLGVLQMTGPLRLV